jgi:hypothetical protein
MFNFIPLLVCVVGGIIYLSTDKPVKELARICFFAGLLVALFQLGARV